MSVISTARIEQTLLAHIIKHPEETYSFSSFLSNNAKTIYKALKSIQDKKLTLELNALTIEANEYDSSITKEKLAVLFEIDYSEDNINEYKKELKKRFLLEQVKSEDISELVIEAEQSEIDIDRLKELTSALQSKLGEVGEENKILYTIPEWLEDYKTIIVKRAESSGQYPTGDLQLDNMIKLGFAPKYQTTIFGASGTGKSSFGRYLVNREINLHIPCVYNTLEMDKIVTMDAMLAMRTGFPIDFFLNKESDKEVKDQVLQILEREKSHLINNKRFMLLEDSNQSFDDLDYLIPDIKRYMGVDYFVMHNDLATMIKDYGGENKASGWEDAQNRSHELCKRHNIHMVNYVQARRDDSSIKIRKEEDLEKFRPRVDSVKNSSAFEERSRVMLGVFRRKYYADRYYRSIDNDAVDLMEDVMEVQFLKQNMGSLPTLKYLFIPSVFQLWHYEEPEPNFRADSLGNDHD